MTCKKPSSNPANTFANSHALPGQPIPEDGASPLSALTIQHVHMPHRQAATRAAGQHASVRVSTLAAAIFSVTLAACGQAGDTGSLKLADAHARPQTASTAQITETAQPSGKAESGLPDYASAMPDSERDAERSVLYSSPALKSVASHDICRSILNRNSLLIGGYGRQALPNTPRPRQGVATVEPTYGSCLVRLTNQSATRGRFHRNDYSRRQAFNIDGTLMFLYAEDGFWHLYDARTGKWLKVLKGLAGDAEPQWHPTKRNLLYFLPTNGVGMKIYQLDVIRNQVTLVSDMTRHVRAHWPDAHTAWTRSEGSPSYNARYWCFMTEHISNGRWQPRGVFTWDMKEQKIIGTLRVNARPDHVSMSPSGRYCVVSGDDNTGTRAYRWNFKAPYSDKVRTPYLQLHHKSEHSDIAFNHRREDVYVSIDYQANRGDVFMVNLKTGEKTSLFPTYLNRTATAMHVSGKSFRKPGWVLISTYGEHHASTPWQNLRYSAARQWPHRKIFAVSLEKSPKIRSLAYTHSDALSYWAEPHATVNQDFTRILFNSTWNSSNARDMEAFMLAIPKNALDRPTR